MNSGMNKNKGIFIIIAAFFLLGIYSLQFYENIFWDSAVYIGIGKYILSMGKAGFFEPSRPLIWPIFLGLLWKIGLDPVIYGRILGLLFALGCIYLSYKIGKEAFNENIAVLSAFLLAFTPSFFFFSNKILSDIPSLFFSLLAVHLFIKKRLFYSGIFAGIAFMARFIQLGVFISIAAIFLLNRKEYKDFNKKAAYLASGFFIALIPFLAFNLVIHKNPIYPLLLQLFMTKYTGLMYNQQFYFYFINILKENFILILSLAGIFFIFKKRSAASSLILTLFLLFLMFFSLVPHKEIRFITAFLPYLSIIASYGFYSLIEYVKKDKARLLILASLILLFVVQITPYFKFGEEENKFTLFQNYMAKEDVKEGIWVTNPIYAVYSDKKISELMYFPVFDDKKISELASESDKAEHILLNSCDLYCEPYFGGCEEKKNDFIGLLKTKFEAVFYEKEGGCESYIFEK